MRTIKFTYSPNYKQAIGTTDTLFYEENFAHNWISSANKPDSAYAHFFQRVKKRLRKDTNTYITNFGKEAELTHLLPNNYLYVEKSYGNRLAFSGYYKVNFFNCMDSVWTFYSSEKEKEIYTFQGKIGEVFQYQLFRNDTLVKMYEVDDTRDFWRCTKYAKGQKVGEIVMKEGKIPHIREWNKKGKLCKEYDSWKYNMFGEITADYFEQPLFLQRFPRYKGIYIKKEEKNDFTEEGFFEEIEDFGEFSEEEWGGNSQREDSLAGEKRKPKPLLHLLDIHWYHNQHFSHTFFSLYRQGIWFKLQKHFDFPESNYVDIPASKPQMPQEIHLPFKGELDYSIQFRENKIMMGEYYKLSLLEYYRIKQNITARAAMQLPQTLYFVGLWAVKEEKTFSHLLKINHNIDANIKGCVGNSYYDCQNNFIRLLYPPITKDTLFKCRYTQNFGCYYNSVTDSMRNYLRTEWTKCQEKDALLKDFNFCKVRLSYKENQLVRVKFVAESRLEGEPRVKQKIPHKRYIHQKLAKIFRQMPSYVRQFQPKKETVSFDYYFSN